MQPSAVACQHCNKSFKSKRALAVHIALAHRRHTGSATEMPPAPRVTDPNPHATDFNVELAALQMLDDGHSPFEIMQIHKLDVRTMKQILQDYRELQGLAQPAKREGEVFLEIARAFGEHFRNGCEAYNDEQGVCTAFALYDVDEGLRRSFPGLFKGSGGKTRYHVLNHPWVCALCRRSFARRGE